MARANLTAKEVAEVMKAISQVISIKRIVKDLDTVLLVEVLNKFEHPEKDDLKILRGLEDKLDLADSTSAHINSFGRPRPGNCGCCDD